MAYNKFITQDGVVALDLTEDTITAETLEKGITAHDKYGVLIVGTMESEEVAEYDGSVVIENAVKLISFTIESTAYQAEEGMTWAEWLTTDYNTNSYTENLLDGTQTVFIEPYGEIQGYGVAYDNSFVSVEDVIVEDRAYTKKLGSHI